MPESLPLTPHTDKDAAADDGFEDGEYHQDSQIIEMGQAKLHVLDHIRSGDIAQSGVASEQSFPGQSRPIATGKPSH